MKKEIQSIPMDLRRIRISDAFWNREQELVRTEVLPYQWEALNDRVPGAAPSYCMHNFRAAARLMEQKERGGREFQMPTYTFRGFESLPSDPKHPKEDEFYGFVFQDTDFSKWIEAVGYSLIRHPDSKLEKTADAAIDLVCAAQMDNGYLDTYYIINGMDRAFTNLRDHHELYCLGHLIEGAVSYAKATGKEKLLQAAMRYADYCADYFGEEEGKCKGYPGHEIAEMALAGLYEYCGDPKYLKLAAYFINERGKQPVYFEVEEQERLRREGKQPTKPVIGEDANWFDRHPHWYHQAHQPVRGQREAVGHAVRAVYLYSGMADVARLTGDDELAVVCCRLFDEIVRTKYYITGGIGGTHMGEAFSFPYDLPNDTAYSETCAAVGMVFFARRMLELHADHRYADVMERSLYNTVLAGMALDGKSFFYVNPLEVWPEACDRDARKAHVKSRRQKWFGCACCPPNIARLVSSVGAYAYTESEDTLYTHLYMSGEVEKEIRQSGSSSDAALPGGGKLWMKVESELPWEGRVCCRIHTKEAMTGTVAFRIPGWSSHTTFTIPELGLTGEIAFDGKEHSMRVEKLTSDKDVRPAQTEIEAVEGKSSANADPKLYLKDGYLYIRPAGKNVAINFDFDMSVHLVRANNRVREDLDKAAVLRGPLTYCMEEVDNGKQLPLLYLDRREWKPEEVSVSLSEEMGHPMAVLTMPGYRDISDSEEQLYLDAEEIRKPERVSLRWIPYYAWNNRGEGEMSVWIRCR